MRTGTPSLRHAPPDEAPRRNRRRRPSVAVTAHCQHGHTRDLTRGHTGEPGTGAVDIAVNIVTTAGDSNVERCDFIPLLETCGLGNVLSLCVITVTLKICGFRRPNPRKLAVCICPGI